MSDPPVTEVHHPDKNTTVELHEDPEDPEAADTGRGKEGDGASPE